MKIVCYPTSGAHQQEAMLNFRRGLMCHGMTDVLICSPHDTQDCDLAVFWGHRHQRLISRQKARGAHYLVMERGYIGDRFLWTSLGFDGLNGRAKFPQVDDGLQRWNHFFAQFLKPQRVNKTRLAVIMGQCRGDASLCGVDFGKWVIEVDKEFKSYGYQTAFRPHPGDPNFPIVGIPILKTTLDEALEAAEVVVTFNSNTGVDAALAGLEVFAQDKGSMIYDFIYRNLPFSFVEVDGWTRKMAYTQWLPYEIENGDAWAALKTVIER